MPGNRCQHTRTTQETDLTTKILQVHLTVGLGRANVPVSRQALAIDGWVEVGGATTKGHKTTTLLQIHRTLDLARAKVPISLGTVTSCRESCTTRSKELDL